MSTPNEHAHLQYCLENGIYSTSQTTIPIEWFVRENAAPDDLTWEPEMMEPRKIINPKGIIEELLEEELAQPRFALGAPPF
jgi:hypothetical protein